MDHGSADLFWDRHPSSGATAIPRPSTMKLGQALLEGLHCWVDRASRRLMEVLDIWSAMDRRVHKCDLWAVMFVLKRYIPVNSKLFFYS